MKKKSHTQLYSFVLDGLRTEYKRIYNSIELAGLENDIMCLLENRYNYASRRAIQELEENRVCVVV